MLCCAVLFGAECCREPPGRDHTYFYSVVGVGIGIAAGWFSQYLH